MATSTTPNTGGIPLLGEIRWQKSSLCGSGGCVEMARAGDSFLVRDSKSDGSVLTFDMLEMSSFVESIKKGEFDRMFDA